LSIEYVLYDMSYANMILYGSVLPSYKSNKDRAKNKKQEIINADDPRNLDKINQFGDD
jgi:hypothetical protein